MSKERSEQTPITSVALNRLIEEVRLERLEAEAGTSPSAYNRMYNRHNRSGGYNRMHNRHMRP